MLLFIYGSLKRGKPNHGFLDGQKFVGEATTHRRYRLLNLGAFPGLVRAGRAAGTAVRGELWEVDAECLEQLDQLEGSPRFYRREPVQLRGRRSAPAYFLQDQLRAQGCREVAGGCW